MDQLDQIQNFKSLSYNRPNIFQLRDRDYGFTKHQNLQDWARTALRKFTDFVPARITLITMPRALGFGFNPVSFWCYFDDHNNLRAVMAEVNNTFSERHAYICMHPDGRAILPTDTLSTQKVFHVSPFFDVRGRYEFRFDVTDKKINIIIDYFDDSQKLLSTSVTGVRQELSDRMLWQAFFKNPIVSLKTLALIHVHAVILIWKSIRYRHPAPLPTEDITR
jgi:DUF1365 family protein